jgi:ADP-glucose pyrophosphorylase
VESKADITVSTIPVPLDQAPGFGIMKVDEGNQIVHFHEKPAPEEVKKSREERLKELEQELEKLEPEKAPESGH